MLAKGASVVAVSVCDVTAAPTLIQKCKDAGNVPIIFFNKEITDYDVINSYEKCLSGNIYRWRLWCIYSGTDGNRLLERTSGNG